MTTNQESTHELCITASGKVCEEQRCKSAQTLSYVNSTTVTAYYSNNQDTDSTPHLNLSTIQSPHVVSTLASQSPIPYMRKMPLCKCEHNNNIYHDPDNNLYQEKAISPPFQAYMLSPLYNNLPAHQSVFTAAWYLLSILVCLIPMASLFNPNRKRIRIRRSYTKRIRQKYPMARPPGTRSKHGKNNTTWNIVYDQRNDTVLIWTNHQVRIYQRRGRRLFTYQKGKSENTVPRHALPISGEWQGSYFIVNYIAHWTNPPTESLPQQCVTPISVTKRNNTQTQMENHQETAMRPPSKTRKLKTDRPRNKTSPKRQSKKVSQKSNQTWRPQVRQFLNWTPHHMDAYLAIPQVAMEWIVEPG